MLRISEGAIGEDTARLVLEGHVIGPWVKELQRACEQFLNQGYGLTLDVGEVSFVDRDGLAVLRELMSGPTTLVNCPLFLRQQLTPYEGAA